MCGIAGLLRTDGAPVSTDRLATMADALHHRGPDATAVAARGGVGLASARLAIVDPGPSGAQPIVADGSMLAFNGELYDHLVLRRRLEEDGVTLAGASDTEVLFHLLARDGVDAVLPRLRGMFAFAWVDREGTTHLVRDRWGVKPLHWARRGREVLWASEVKAIAAVAEVRPRATLALAGALSLADRWATRTVFADVQQVGPGEHVAIAADGTVRARRWHRARDEVDPDLAASLAALPSDEVDALVGDLLADAVARMDGRDDVEPSTVATLVSGGLDSSLVAALASAEAGGHHLFTADVQGALSEAPAARALAARLGRPLTEVPFEASMVVTDWAQATWHHEAPIVTHVNGLALARVAAAVHDAGAKAVLCGEGADELFAGYATMAGRRQLEVLRLPYRALRRGYGLVPGLADKVLPAERSNEQLLAALTDDFEQARADHDAAEALEHLAPADARATGLVLLALQGHLRTLLHRDDRMGMQHHVEARFPFLDEPLVRVAVNLPHHHRVDVTRRLHDRKHPFLTDKALLRRLAEQHGLPGARRPKQGFPSWGHAQVRVGVELFRGGWLAEELALSEASLVHLVEAEHPYQVAKLASVEVFGRLYGRGEEVAAVQDLLQQTATMAVGRDDQPRRRPGIAWDRWRSPI